MRRKPCSNLDDSLLVKTFFLTLFVMLLPPTMSQKSQDNETPQVAGITNPYYSGCLYEKLPGWKKKRVCSKRQDRDTLAAKAAGLCEEPHFDYLEIRIGAGNWDSATAMGWLVQIILSEMLGVPTSIESGQFGTSRDFYDPTGRVDYNRSTGVNGLIRANQIPGQDCRTAQASATADNYEPCIHFMPEAWGLNDTLVKIQVVEPPQGLGVLGLETWFVTRFTAEEYPELTTYHGLRKPENREKLARVFKRPTTWKDYCNEVSSTACQDPDGVAERAPQNEEEEQRMFERGLYTGHFRYTEKNNCTMFPTNCTGHIADYPCGWTSNMEATTYHLGIALDSKNGPNNSPSGYTQDQLVEMWNAANATKEHLMMMWWKPEPLYQRFIGTDAEFQRVALPPFTLKCEKAFQATSKDECSADLEERVGAPDAACEFPPEPLRKLIVAGLRDLLQSPDVDEAARNPAYDVMRLFQMTEVQLEGLFDFFETEATSRDAVCAWAIENLDVLNATIPRTFPRVTQKKPQTNLGLVATTFAIFSTCLIFFTSFMVYLKREKPAIQFAQLDFLLILLTGSVSVCVGAILNSLPSSDGTCVATIWFVYLGYSLELVPLIIKVAAINRMMGAARALRRITLKRENLYRDVGLICCCAACYLAVWTALDRPRPVDEYTLTTTMTEQGEVIVKKSFFCSVDSEGWQFAAEAWNTVLLMSASVLAFQTREVVQQFNESRVLAFLIYSHFVFVILRMGTFVLSDNIKGSVLIECRTLFYAVDQVAAVLIYFLPKLTAKDEQVNNSSSAGGQSNGRYGLSFSNGAVVLKSNQSQSQNSASIRTPADEYSGNKSLPEESVRIAQPSSEKISSNTAEADEEANVSS